MGIKQLFSIIKDEAPDAYKEGEIKNQFGRKVAIVSYTLQAYQHIQMY
jgi:flap endonuclease-1